MSCDSIMDHVDQSIGGIYRQVVADKRLLKAVNTVRDWLFDAKGGAL